jgi:hypothetical protein
MVCSTKMVNTKKKLLLERQIFKIWSYTHGYQLNPVFFPQEKVWEDDDNEFTFIIIKEKKKNRRKERKSISSITIY